MFATETMPFVVALRTIAPFIVEGTCVLIIFITAAFLSFPFMSHVSLFFANRTGKIKNNPSEIALTEGATYPPSVTRYPPLPELQPSINSVNNSTPELSVLHLKYPTPVNRSSEEVSVEENCTPRSETEIGKPPEKDDAVTPMPASPCPIFDSSKFVNYNSYRHKLIEETLQKQYGGGYAPGNVILNLIQLNTPDSAASVILAKKYDRSFFEHIQFRDAVARVCKSGSNSSVSTWPDIEYPDPLTHFIPRNIRKPSTLEMQTETAEASETSVVAKVSMPTRPNTPSSCQRMLARRSRDGGSVINSTGKSPFVTPAHSEAPLNSHASLTPRTRDHQRSDSPAARIEVVSLLQDVRPREVPLTEQLYRRNDVGPDFTSKTHVEAQEYLNRIAKNKKYEVSANKQTSHQSKIRSSLKKPGPRIQDVPYEFSRDNQRAISPDRTGDCKQIRGSGMRNNLRHLSSSKPTVWNN